MSPSVTPEVLVVGSGPAGLVLALTLAKNGVSVRIIEKNTEIRVGERGAGVMPRTLEVEHFLGVCADVQRSGLPSPAVHLFDTKDPYRIVKTFELGQQVAPTPSSPITDSVMIGQWLHQQILTQHLEKLGCQVELGCMLQSIKQDDDGVIVHLSKTKDREQIEETARFAYVVGADGARSTVRKSLGINFVGESRDTRVYLVDARIEGLPVEGKDLYKWGDGATIVASLRYTVRKGVFQMLLAGEDVDFELLKSGSPKAVQSTFSKLTGRMDLKVTEVLFHGEWRPNIRVAEHFRSGRVFIVGDAAHVHAPAGGQGLNTGIKDSFNLGWKLALSLKSRASPTLLDSYESERLPVIAEMLNITTELFSKTGSKSGLPLGIEVTQARAKAAEGEKDKQTYSRDPKLLQLGVNYRWSEIVFDERFTAEKGNSNIEKLAYGDVGHDVRAGDRAPDAPELTSISGDASGTSVTRLFDIFKPAAHTALFFVPDASEASTADLLAPLSRIPKEFIQVALIIPSGASKVNIDRGPVDVDHALNDSEGHAYTGYGLKPDRNETWVVMIRPDAVIGAFVKSAQGVEKYLSLVFG